MVVKTDMSERRRNMITEAFDNQSPAIINPQIKVNAPQVDACILTFSHMIEKFVLENYDCRQIGRAHV